MTDPLSRYPPMMSISDLEDFLGVSHGTAWAEMQKMPHTSVGGGKVRKHPRVSQDAVRKHYNLPEPKHTNLRIAR
jgi:hypothetical protein